MQPGEFTLVQLSDTHLYADEQGELLGVNTQESLRQVLAMLRRRGLDRHELMVTGDLVHDESAAGYRRLGQVLGEHAAQACFVPGNHDAPALMRDLLPGRVVTDHQVFSYGNWRVLVFSSHQPGEVAGRLGSEALDWLAAQLAADDFDHALIFLHHPPVAVGSRWLDQLALLDGAELLAVAAASGRVRGIAFGHVHQEYEHRHQGISLLGVPSTCTQFLPGATEFATEASAPGCRVLHCFADGRLQTRVLRTGEQ